MAIQMKPALLLCLPLAACAAPATLHPDPVPEHYEALGNEPGWHLTIAGGRIDYVGDYGETKISVPRPDPRPSVNGRRYYAGRLIVDITYSPCNDGMSGRGYEHRVMVTANGKTVRGCGGARRPSGTCKMPIADMLTLLAAAAAPPPTPPSLPWHVFGIDSEWTLDIGGDRMVFTAKGKPPVSAEAGKPVLGEAGWTWKGGGLSVESLPLGCRPQEGGERYPDFVTVTVGHRSYTGCGGAKLAEDDLFGTSWEIVEIAGGKVGGADYGIDFVADHFLAYDGCHRVDGGYRQDAGKLTLTVAGGTEGSCDPVAARCAARFWQILAEPVAIAFADRNHLVLTGKDGTIRLQTPDKEHLFTARTLTPCDSRPPA